MDLKFKVAGIVILFCSALSPVIASELEENFEGSEDGGRERVLDPEEASFLTSVKLENGNTVRFYEASPGEILVGEGGTYPNKPALDSSDYDGVDALTLFNRLTRGQQTPPKNLIEASERERALTEQLNLIPYAPGTLSYDAGEIVDENYGPFEMLSEAAPFSAINTSKCPWSWFNGQFYHDGHAGNARKFTWAWPTRTGTTWVSKNRATVFAAGACSYRGTIRYTMSYTKGPLRPIIPAVWLNEGQWWWWARSTTGFWAYNFKSHVGNASGDGYHHKAVGCKRRWWTGCGVGAPNGSSFWGS